MRREFEAALGRLITNRMDLDNYFDDQEAFLNRYSLSSSEAKALRQMDDGLEVLNEDFIGKRKSVLERPARRTLTFLGDYGNKLTERYMDVHPPLDYFEDRIRFFGFLREAVDTSNQPALIGDVVQMESFWFTALNTPLSSEQNTVREQTSHSDLNNSSFSMETKIGLREGVCFGDFEYDFTYFPQLALEEIVKLKPDKTSLIVYRRESEQSNTILRVTPWVNLALKHASGGKRVSDVARSLSRVTGEPSEVLHDQVMELFDSFMKDDILIKEGKYHE